MHLPFIVYLKNKTSLSFEYKRDVSSVARTENGFRITFNNGKSYPYGADKVRYHPFISGRENVRIYEKGELNERYNTADNYDKYWIFRNGNNYSNPIEANADIEICDTKKNINQAKSTINYFKRILRENNIASFDIHQETNNKNSNKSNSDILLGGLDGIDILDSRSALSNYIDGINPFINSPNEMLIYPFGCNESQKLAIETTLSNNISVVEGPPGTGKTQTILNIIANLIVQNKTIAIVSNNNSAVFNVRDKLSNYGYEMIAALLGSKNNKTSFFDSLGEQTVRQDFEISEERLKDAKDEVRNLDATLTTSFRHRNRLAVLRTALSDAELEFSHVKAEQPLDQDIQSILDKKFHRKWDPRKTLKFKKFLPAICSKRKLSLIDMFQLILRYGLFDLNSISQYSDELPVYVNHKFYELYITNLKIEILDIEHWLTSNNEETNLKRFVEVSKEVFNAVLFKKYNQLEKVTFTINNYRKQFNVFTKHYPVILSSTHSLYTSIPKGYLFDYLIIDEASQVDIIKSTICFSCCRNVIIVGDSMQITHIVDKQSKEASEKFKIEYSIPPAYDYVEKNILDSLKILYRGNLKSVLLKEHYRCHPIIIGFCNKKYYKNSLVIMTYADTHPFKIIETNRSGERENCNQRQIDETIDYINKKHSDFTKVGVIAPYRNHVKGLQEKLPEGAEADTIHKFQGREKDVIIFNTVKDEIESFIDDPNLINVAVSRSVKEFIIIKPQSMKLHHGTNIGDLIRYMRYTADPKKTIVRGSIRSVFDLLYKEYDHILTPFLSLNKDVKGSPAEIITYKLLHENILTDTQFSSIDVVREYKLRDLIRDLHPFTQEEIRFITSDSRIDFLLYNKIDKEPVLAIEVDGVSFHNNALQRERDKNKDRILEKIKIPLLRLSTDGHNEETKIIEKLNTAMKLSRSDNHPIQ